MNATATRRPLKPIAQILLTVTATEDARRLLDPLAYQVGRADRVTLDAKATLAPPRSDRLQDVAEWMGDNWLEIVAISDAGRHQRRVIIGARP